MPFARQRVPQDHRHPVGIERALRIAVIQQGLACALNGPLLADVHRVQHTRRDGDAPLERIKVESAHPCPDLAVRFIRGGMVGVIIKGRPPAVVADICDRVAARLDVVPKSPGVVGIGQNRAHSNHGNSVNFTHYEYLLIKYKKTYQSIKKTR